MRNQKKSPAPEAARFPNRTSAPGRRDQQHRVLKDLQPRAIRRDRRDDGRRGPIHHPSGPAPRSAKLGRKPPTIPLTLRAMLGSRHLPARGSGRSVFSLLSVLAVLAFALLPAAANADSAGYEYENAVPTPTGGAHKAPTVVGGGGEEDKAEASDKGGGSTGGTGPGSGGGSTGDGHGSTPAGQGSGEHTGGNGSTSPQHQNDAKDAGGQAGKLTAVPADSQGSDGGGSSPVVPILIVVALLAAISVGVVYWQRRRGGDADSPITPKAG